MFTPVLNNKPAHIKLLAFILLVISSLILVNIAGVVLATPFFGEGFLSEAGSSINQSVSKLKYLQILNQISLFVVPPMLYVLLHQNSYSETLNLNKKFHWPLVLLSLTVLFCAIPVLDFSGEINQSLKLPSVFSSADQWMRQTEAEAIRLTGLFLNTNLLSGFLVNLLMMAVLPAIGEEFFFRGVLQKIFQQWFKNAHIGIVLTAVIFSIMHLQFFGFLPRLLLGLFIGYVFYWSGNLWIAIILHFVNNAVIVVYAFSLNLNGGSFDPAATTDNNPAWLIIASAAAVVLIIYFIRRLKPAADQPTEN